PPAEGPRWSRIDGPYLMVWTASRQSQYVCVWGRKRGRGGRRKVWLQTKLHTATDCAVWLNPEMTTTSDTAPASPAPARGHRLSAADWAQAALDVIAEQGVSAVAVEPLARRLGVTKGSFYWHFPSRDTLLQAALDRWEEVEQEQVFGSLEEVADP